MSQLLTIHILKSKENCVIYYKSNLISDLPEYIAIVEEIYTHQYYDARKAKVV